MGDGRAAATPGARSRASGDAGNFPCRPVVSAMAGHNWVSRLAFGRWRWGGDRNDGASAVGCARSHSNRGQASDCRDFASCDTRRTDRRRGCSRAAKAGIGRWAKAYDEAPGCFWLGSVRRFHAVEERAMRDLVCRLFTRMAASLWGLALRRKPEAPPAAPGPAIAGAANHYWVAPMVKAGTGGQIWAVHRDNRAETVATSLTLAQARTLCGLLNRLGGFAASERRFSAGVKPPRIQSPDI
jgi:hypothetical protein